ncbi:hypothetical protein [Chryseobacterium camelliae]|uniref:hypothetical protein n=1 Tax=Chryseobacterium camelliae TaxID=1265445 RepID=UPI0028594292|nr:hypothetical protein [Chryseobacterium camelliae]MDR6515451.1 hypothetical protein [Chryseobacterium camelliae]
MKTTTLILGILGLMSLNSCAECEIEEDEPVRTEQSDPAERTVNDTIGIRHY